MTTPAPDLTLDEQRAALRHLIDNAGDVERLRLEPGDRLVIKVDRPPDALRQIIEGGNK